mgnify:CR=1 FL=1|tara:strand:- start:684 stop:1043 length:360 start_codon:yes stop_codon:yes gene_type:complete
MKLKFLLLASAMTLITSTVSAGMAIDVELETQIEKKMGQPVVQKISNHFYNAEQPTDGFNIVSVYWVGTKVFKKDNSCLVMEQKLSHIETFKGEGKELKRPILTQHTQVTDCEPEGFLI